MSLILRTACDWSRRCRRRMNLDGSAGGFTVYQPGRVSVAYALNAEGIPQIRRVLVYQQNKSRSKLSGSYASVPKYLEQDALRIVRNNEANYGRQISSVIFPDGRTVHA